MNMQYVEYIQNGNSNANSNGWNIPLNYHPSVTSNVKMRVKINRLNTYDGYLTVGVLGGSGNYFRFFTYQAGKMFFDCPNDSDARIGLGYTPETPTIWEMGTTGASDYYLSNLTNGTTTATTIAKSRTFTKDFFVYGETTANTISEYQKIYYIEMYENDVKVKDYRPAMDDNGVVCLYETIGGTYHYNQGSKTLTAGPSLSSIVATPSKKSLASTGETINIAVACENAWTVTGNTWLTLSATGGTGDTTITATAPDYSGSTERIDNLTFIDSVTGDEFPLAIKQRRNTGGGMPFVIGGIEVYEAYVGDIPLGEAYLGEELMFSAGAGPVLPDQTVVINSWAEGYVETSGDPERELVVKNGNSTLVRVLSTYDENEGSYVLSVTGNGFTAEFDENDTQTISVTGPWDSAVTYSLSAITYGSQGIYYLTEYMADTLGPQGNNHFNPTGDTNITWFGNDYSAPDITLHMTGMPQMNMDEYMLFYFNANTIVAENWDIQFGNWGDGTVVDTTNLGERWSITNFNSGAGTFDIIGPFLPYDDTFAEYRIYTDVYTADGNCTTEPETITFPGGGATAWTETFPSCIPDNSAGGGNDGGYDPDYDEDL